jgi:hypothetical protein
MAIVCGQVTSGAAAAPLCTMPPGACRVTIVNTSAVAADFVLIGNAGVTVADGGPVPAGQSVTLEGFPGSAGAQLYVIAAAGTPVVGFFISTPK